MMRPPRIRILLLTMAALAAFSSTSVWAQKWSIMKTLDPGNSLDLLGGVAARSATDAWAVGAAYSDAYSPRTLTEHWDGTRWTAFKSPSPGNEANCGPNESDMLNAVAAIAADDVWAVGSYCILNPQPLVIHWNGSKWKHVTVPQPQDAISTVFYAIAATGPNDVWIAGAFEIVSYTDDMIVEHWDGKSWTIVFSPGHFNRTGALMGIAALSPTNVWSVGSDKDDLLIAEHFDGAQWSAVPTPQVSEYFSVLNSITALSENDIWAVGAYQNTQGTVDSGLVLHWNGSGWSQEKSPNWGPGNQVVLRGISALSANDIWAVGDYGDSDTLQAVSQHWDGTRWSKAGIPRKGLATQLFGVANAEGQTFAVGAYSNTGSHYGRGLRNPKTFVLTR
jgi:hypothetical protein